MKELQNRKKQLTYQGAEKKMWMVELSLESCI